MRGSNEIIKRTVIVESVALSKKKIETLKEVEAKYREILQQVMDFGIKNRITSFARLKGKVYHELREKYPDLPSHYIHSVCQDASARLESFEKMKRKGKARTERPEIHKVSIWLDDHVGKQLDDYTIRVSTHKGYVLIPINTQALLEIQE